MYADKIVEVLLGGSQLQHSSEALGHLASVGAQVVEADDFLLENINSSQYNNTILFCALPSEWLSKLASGSRCCPACAPRSTPAARSSGDTPPRELSTKFHENITIFVGGTKATHSIERRFKQG